MVFGVFVDVPLLTVPFLLMLRFRRRLSNEISRLRLPLMGLYLSLTVPLLIFEEQIDCQPSWCGAVVVPPTIPFLLLEMLALGGLVTASCAEAVAGYTRLQRLRGLVRTLPRRPCWGPDPDSGDSSALRCNGLRICFDATIVSSDRGKEPTSEISQPRSTADWDTIV